MKTFLFRGFPHSDAALPSDLSRETQHVFYGIPLSSACFNTKHCLTFEAISAAFHSKMLFTVISGKENSSLNKIILVVIVLVSKY